MGDLLPRKGDFHRPHFQGLDSAIFGPLLALIAPHLVGAFNQLATVDFDRKLPATVIFEGGDGGNLGETVLTPTVRAEAPMLRPLGAGDGVIPDAIDGGFWAVHVFSIGYGWRVVKQFCQKLQSGAECQFFGNFPIAGETIHKLNKGATHGRAMVVLRLGKDARLPCLEFKVRMGVPKSGADLFLICHGNNLAETAIGASDFCVYFFWEKTV